MNKLKMAALVAAGCTLTISAPPDAYSSIVPGWSELVVSPMGLSTGPRAAKRQRADILHLGGARFVVGWIGGDHCIRVNSFDVDEGYQQLGTLQPLACLSGKNSSNDVGWIRAAGESPISVPYLCTQKTNWLTFHYWDSPSLSYRVKVDRVDNLPCTPAASAVTHTLIDIGAGQMPAIAVLPRPVAVFPDRQLPPTALVVWLSSNRTQIWGRFVSTMGVGSPFLVHAPLLESGQYLATPDLHYNTVSQRFVLGFGLGGLPFTNQPCRYYNMLMDVDGVPARAPLPWGMTCDNEAGGPHHTSVAFDSSSAFNPSGHYVWWYMGPLGKGLYTFNKDGIDLGTAFATPAGTDAYTRPLTSLPTHQNGNSYAAAGLHQDGDSGSIGDIVHYVRNINLAKWSSPDGFSTSGDNFPVAIRGIDGHTVGLYQGFNTSQWRISVSDR